MGGWMGAWFLGGRVGLQLLADGWMDEWDYGDFDGCEEMMIGEVG